MGRYVAARAETAGFLALKSVGLRAGIPIRASAVMVIPPLGDANVVTGTRQGLSPARVTTIVATRKRLLEELAGRARDSGAIGIVDVRFKDSKFPAQFQNSPRAVIEVSATALPVAAAGSAAADAFFRTALPPADVATLLRMGWVPVDVLVAGDVLTRAIQHRQADARAATGYVNTEIPGATDLIQRARRQLRDSFHRAARDLGADGVLLSGFETAWSATYHLVEISAVANAIAGWGDQLPRVKRGVTLGSGSAITGGTGR